jgi:hypothetical protein
MTGAFARVKDARYAIGILERCAGGPIGATVREQLDARGAVEIVLVDIEVGLLDPDRIRAAFSGGHGVLLPRPLSMARSA